MKQTWELVMLELYAKYYSVLSLSPSLEFHLAPCLGAEGEQRKELCGAAGQQFNS